jgi:hypothetical protein
MNFAPFKTLDRRQVVWMIQAYFKLWWVVGRLKFSDSDWLMTKIEFGESVISHNAGEHSKQKSSPTTRLSTARDLHESIRLAARLNFLRLDCLPKSIVLSEMLVSKGIVAHIKVGVAKDSGGGLASHAWVEVDKTMVAEPETVKAQFKRLS